MEMTHMCPLTEHDCRFEDCMWYCPDGCAVKVLALKKS